MCYPLKIKTIIINIIIIRGPGFESRSGQDFLLPVTLHFPIVKSLF